MQTDDAHLVSPSTVACGLNRFLQIAADGHEVWWLEQRPSEKGRSVLMRYRELAKVEELLPRDISARSRLNTYGGTAFACRKEINIFLDDAEQQITRLDGMLMQKISETPGATFGDFTIHPAGKWVLSVMEKKSEIENRIQQHLILLDAEGEGDLIYLHSGLDFYGHPRFSPDGSFLSFIGWSLPDMPWESSRLYVAPFAGDRLQAEPEILDGGNNISVLQPEWISSKDVLYLSDRTGFWNPHITSLAERKIIHWIQDEKDYGWPFWTSSISSYALNGKGEAVFAVTGKEGMELIHCSPPLLEGKLQPAKQTVIPLQLSEFSFLTGGEDSFYFAGSSASRFSSIYSYNKDSDRLNEIRQTTSHSFPERLMPSCQTLSILDDNTSTTIPAFLFSPRPESTQNPGKPPLIVKCHGGPTARAPRDISLEILFWIERGVAYMTVDYAGSSGYGRAYRDRLRGKWGLEDAQDVIAATRYVQSAGWIDPKKVWITGSSSGGYTALNAMSRCSLFRGGSIYYGVSDLESLRRETHRFESGYLDWLVGAYDPDLYHRRSPVHRADEINGSLIFFQGGKDRIVPPGQTETMVEQLKVKGKTVEYYLYPDEAHGFRSSDNIEKALTAEWNFFQKIMSQDQ